MIKKRLISLLSHAQKYIVLHVLWQWISLITQIIAIFTVANLLGQAYLNDLDSERIIRSIVILFAVLLIRFVCEKMQVRYSYLASVDVKRIVREKIYKKLLHLGAAYREQISTAEVVQIASEGVEQLETYFGKYLPQFFYSMLAPLTLFLVLAFVDFQSSVILLICVPLIPISIVVVQKIAKRLLSKYWGAYTKLGDSFLENLQGLTTLKIYQADEQKMVEMDAEANHFRKITMKVLTMQLNSTSVMDIVAYGGAAIGMLVAATGCLSGRITFTQAITIILLASEFFLPLRLLGSYFHIAMNGMAASDKIFRLLDLAQNQEGTMVLPDMIKDMTFSNVHYSYESEREIIKGITLQIPACSLVSIVGESGCGKSTITGLLMGRNHGYTGNIRIGDAELSSIKEASLMQYITLVKHDSYIFKGTVRENLCMANPNATDEALIDALKKVNIWSFIKHQNGLDTMLTERANNLSGGQRQRIALARAILSNAKVFIFDEATSNIDAESESIIMQVIEQLAQTKTVILISHRLSNVVHADCIYMMENGCITEQGTHKDLLQKNGSYARLFQTQQKLEQYSKEETVC